MRIVGPIPNRTWHSTRNIKRVALMSDRTFYKKVTIPETIAYDVWLCNQVMVTECPTIFNLQPWELFRSYSGPANLKLCCHHALNPNEIRQEMRKINETGRPEKALPCFEGNYTPLRGAIELRPPVSVAVLAKSEQLASGTVTISGPLAEMRTAVQLPENFKNGRNPWDSCSNYFRANFDRCFPRRSLFFVCGPLGAADNALQAVSKRETYYTTADDGTDVPRDRKKGAVQGIDQDQQNGREAENGPINIKIKRHRRLEVISKTEIGSSREA
ncbi:hypothetical protein DFH06DRAFT_1120885 [Mycena polygramma]|nr:hypothetical protein DFH06DRAFT_1120885 [Mycena polygramma]